MPRVLIPLAEGCEELEAVTLIDLLRRAQINVVTASLTERHQVTASRGTRLLSDVLLDDVVYDDFDMLLLPGGQPGTHNLDNDHRIHAMLKRLDHADKYIAAICAAPMVLASTGLLNERQATAYPGTLEATQWPEITISNDPIVIDNNILTSRGPGTAMDFALTIIELLVDQATRDTVESGLVRP